MLRQSWTARPCSHEPRRGLRPRVAAHHKWARIEALHRNRAFIDDYRETRRLWLAGFDVTFPYGTYWLRRFANVPVAKPPTPPATAGPTTVDN